MVDSCGCTFIYYVIITNLFEGICFIKDQKRNNCDQWALMAWSRNTNTTQPFVFPIFPPLLEAFLEPHSSTALILCYRSPEAGKVVWPPCDSSEYLYLCPICAHIVLFFINHWAKAIAQAGRSETFPWCGRSSHCVQYLLLVCLVRCVDRTNVSSIKCDTHKVWADVSE